MVLYAQLVSVLQFWHVLQESPFLVKQTVCATCKRAATCCTECVAQSMCCCKKFVSQRAQSMCCCKQFVFQRVQSMCCCNFRANVSFINMLHGSLFLVNEQNCVQLALGSSAAPCCKQFVSQSMCCCNLKHVLLQAVCCSKQFVAASTSCCKHVLLQACVAARMSCCTLPHVAASSLFVNACVAASSHGLAASSSRIWLLCVRER